MTNSWNEAISNALGSRDGWRFAVEPQPIMSIADLLANKSPRRFEYLARLEFNGSTIEAWRWIEDVSTNHPDKLKIIDYGVMERAIADLRASPTSQADINISASVLEDKQFPMTISQEIAHLGKHRLHIDLGLRQQLNDAHIRTLAQLKENHIKIALDDFGDRATDMDVIRYKPDGVKVSASIIQELDGPNKRYAQNALLNMASAMQYLRDIAGFPILPTVFKGVASKGHLNLLKDLCGDEVFIQGRIVPSK